MNTSPTPLVGLVMGSESDFDALVSAFETLNAFGVPFEVRVLSAHRTPGEAAAYAASARDRGIKVLLCAAGGAAHLAGVVAGNTTLPVIGIPVKGAAFDGLDAMLSTIMMPSGIPVATVAVDGAKNAALLAVEILAVTDAGLAAKLEEARRKDKEAVLAADEELRQKSQAVKEN
jgi:5-(carboxyamino)imidazole ribonucleotide mutase